MLNSKLLPYAKSLSVYHIMQEFTKGDTCRGGGSHAKKDFFMGVQKKTGEGRMWF